MIVLSANEQQQLLTMNMAIEAVATALRAHSQGEAVTPMRTYIPVPKDKGTSIFMPSLVTSTESLGIKFVSVFPHNNKKGKKAIYGVFILANAETGEPLAMLEASYLTVIRTGAACGLATRYLSREKARVLAMIGTGAQARGIVKAVMAVREIERVHLYNRSILKAKSFAHELREEFGSNAPHIIVMDNADQAVEGADIIATASNSHSPVFSGHRIQSGVHINAVGSFKPDMQEIPSEIVQSSKIVVESRAGALEETGDLIIPIQNGMITPEDIYAEMGELVSGLKEGRVNENEMTLFKSVGLAAMDVVVAHMMYKLALERKMGQIVQL